MFKPLERLIDTGDGKGLVSKKTLYVAGAVVLVVLVLVISL